MVNFWMQNNFANGRTTIFLSRKSKDGRILIPKLEMALFKDGKPHLVNHVAEVMLKPL